MGICLIILTISSVSHFSISQPRHYGSLSILQTFTATIATAVSRPEASFSLIGSDLLTIATTSNFPLIDFPVGDGVSGHIEGLSRLWSPANQNHLTKKVGNIKDGVQNSSDNASIIV